MGSLAGPKARREPAGEAKPDVCEISDGEAGAYCTVGLFGELGPHANFTTLEQPLLGEKYVTQGEKVFRRKAQEQYTQFAKTNLK